MDFGCYVFLPQWNRLDTLNKITIYLACHAHKMLNCKKNMNTAMNRTNDS